jgi:homoserine O-acetyltransferase
VSWFGVSAAGSIPLSPAGPRAQDGRQQFASLGNFRLENGETIRDCRIGYRTFGRTNTDRSNVVVISTWFTGTTADLQPLLGPGHLVDTSRYYVVAIDALGNGVSSSPSNSTAQSRMNFPRFSMRDIVNSQYALLTGELGISHVHAVVGSSMAGMQVFEWIVSYPTFADRAVTIGGSPRLTPYDLLLWQTQRDAITSDPMWNGGRYTSQPGTRLVGEIATLIDISPDVFNETHEREDVAVVIGDTAKAIARFDASDHIRQSEAMTGHDVSARFGGSMERAAAAVKAKVLVVVSAGERVVTPRPAIAFARLIHADLLELQNKCGLALSNCDRETVNRAVASFLEQ